MSIRTEKIPIVFLQKAVDKVIHKKTNVDLWLKELAPADASFVRALSELKILLKSS